MQEISRLRQWSQICWLIWDDVPTKYFLNQLKAKQARESIYKLRLEDGTVIENEEDILLEVFRFYSTLYRSNLEVTNNYLDRQNVLKLIQKTITEEYNESMLELPSEDEIKRMVRDLPKEKSPGIDGVTAEVLQQFWPVMKPVCIALVHAYWIDGRLTSKASAGVIKLIPKNMEILLLLNWRPLTMLTLIEKLCAKILASCMKEPTNRVVDPQQTGFLKGRSIMDNLLTYKLAQELVTKTRQEVVVLKVDFLKVYNRVEHVFIWDTMLAMGFDRKIVRLAQGLVE